MKLIETIEQQGMEQEKPWGGRRVQAQSPPVGHGPDTTMRSEEATEQEGSTGPDHFRMTYWSVIRAAGIPGAAESEAALERLCRTYWYPVYAFIRRRGHAVHDAQDLTQAFFSHLLAGSCLQSADRSKGRFRSYLVGTLKNFLANEWDKANRLKRGGGREILSWEGLDPEERFLREPAQSAPTEKLLDREWARALVGEALRKLRSEAEREGSKARFEVLKHFLGGTGADTSYAAAAAALNMSEPAVKSAIHRLRQRFAKLFRAEVQQTVANSQEAEAEIRHLFAALGDQRTCQHRGHRGSG